MKSFFEKHRDEEQRLNINRNRNHNFPAHFHSNLEIFIVKKGKYNLWINEKEWEITSGCIAVVDSFQIHSYQKTDENGEVDDCVVIIPYRALSRFSLKRKGLKLACPVLQDGALCDRLLFIVGAYMQGQSADIADAATDLFLSVLFEHLQFTEQDGRDESALVRQILTYLQEHFQGDVSRAAIAKALGYSQEHISRVFRRYTGKSLTEYVNGLRFSYMEQLYKTGDTRTATELMFESGFKSERTYYRQKKKWEQGE